MMPSHENNAHRSSLWTVAGVILLGGGILTQGLLASVSNIWAPRAGDVLWRVVTSSQLLGGMGNIVVGFFLLVMACSMAGSPGWLRATALLGFVMMAAVLAVVGSLSLDYLQFRPAVDPEGRQAWDLSTATSAMTGLLATPVLWIIIRCARTLARELSPLKKSVGDPILVRTE